MTNEEREEVIKILKKASHHDITIFDMDNYYNVLDMVIATLKAESCEYAVGAIMHILTELGYGDEENGADAEYMSALCDVAKKVKALPCDTLKLDGMLEDAYEHGYDQARHDFETQPCEDAVSREAAKKTHCDICMDKNICYRNKENCEELDSFDKLPPVTPKQKTLKWIPVKDPYTELPPKDKLWVTRKECDSYWVDIICRDMNKWSDYICDIVAYAVYEEPEPWKGERMRTKTYYSMGQYSKDNVKYVDRYGDTHYKRKIKKCVVNRYGDVVKVIAK